MLSAEPQRLDRRRELRALLRPYVAPNYSVGFALLALDLGLFFGGSYAVVVAPLAGKLAASLLLALIISRLFILGHDACHQSLTPSRRLNNILGRVLFLPTYTAYSLWQAGHNVAHHGFANLRQRDVPFVPLSPAEYAALPELQRALYRAYRSWWGGGLYYGYAVWWQRMIFPKGKTRLSFVLDSWLVTVFFFLQAGCYVVAAQLTQQSPWLLAGLGIALPFVLWLYMAATVFFIHHTDETAHWFDDMPSWRAAQPNLDATHDTRLPLRFDLLLHGVMRHTAHHVNASIPCYRLPRAQQVLVRAYPDEIKLRRIGLRRYLAITRQCQLYDSGARRWRSCAEVDTAAVNRLLKELP